MAEMKGEDAQVHQSSIVRSRNILLCECRLAGTLDPRTGADGGAGRGQVGGGPAGSPIAEPEPAFLRSRLAGLAGFCMLVSVAPTRAGEMAGVSLKPLRLLSKGFVVPKLVAKWRSVTAGDRSGLSISRERFRAMCMLTGLRAVRVTGTLSKSIDSSIRGVERERLCVAPRESSERSISAGRIGCEVRGISEPEYRFGKSE